MKDFPKFSGANLLANRSNVQGVSWSRKTLSAESGVEPQAIFRYEHKGRCPSFNDAIALSQAMGVSLKELTTNAKG